MKLWRSVLTAVFTLAMAAPGWAEIREVRSIREMMSLIEPGTMIIFDIDNTTLRPAQTLGSDQFFRYLLAKNRARGLKDKEAIETTLAQVTPVQPRSPVLPVEAMTPGLIRELQDEGYVLFALTARPEAWDNDTIDQLASIGVNFTRTSPIDATIRGGVHFQAPGSQKGPDLLELLARFGERPKKIVFIDDRQANVESVDTALNSTAIPHWSLRYAALDEWVASLDPEVAELEWRIFQASGRFMSDEQARACLGRVAH